MSITLRENSHIFRSRYNSCWNWRCSRGKRCGRTNRHTAILFISWYSDIYWRIRTLHSMREEFFILAALSNCLDIPTHGRHIFNCFGHFLRTGWIAFRLSCSFCWIDSLFRYCSSRRWVLSCHWSSRWRLLGFCLRVWRWGHLGGHRGMKGSFRRFGSHFRYKRANTRFSWSLFSSLWIGFI